MNKLLVATCFLFLFILQLHAQSPAEVEAETRKKFPEHAAVFLERATTVNLVVEGDSLKAYADVFEDILHLKDQSEFYGSRKVYGSSFNEIGTLKAKTLVGEKNRYKSLPVTTFKKNSAADGHVFYDDSYFYSFNYPSVAAGNRTQLAYTEIQKDVRFLSGYIFTSYLPQLKSKYKVIAPKTVDLHFEVFNDPSKKIKMTKSEKGNSVEYEWTMDEVKEIDTDEGSPSIRYYEPHVVCYVKSFYGKNGKHDLLTDVAGLYKWYYSLIKDVIEDEPSAVLRDVVNQITAKQKNEEEIVRAVFYWVQRNIHYIAFEDGMRGFIPNRPSYTCEKKYGDCKDMANLIVGMLKVAGIKAYPTWIGTRDLPYTYAQVPTPLADNHMIATYISPSGQYYFLDATGQYTPFGFPTAMIQGKQALIAIDSEKFEIKEVPGVDKSKNVIKDSLHVRLAENILVGAGIAEVRGLAKANAASYLERVDQKNVRDFVIQLVGKGSNKFFLDDYAVSNANSFDSATLVNYQFRIGDYCQKAGDELYINLNLSKDNYNRIINEKTRTTPHEFDFKYQKSEVVELEIPAGYELEYLPPSESYSGKLMGYNVRYEVSSNKIRYKKEYYIDYLLMSLNEFSIWNEDVRRISNVYQETIILKKKV